MNGAVCTCPSGWGASKAPDCPVHSIVHRTRSSVSTIARHPTGTGPLIPADVLFSDSVLDRTLDELGVHLAAAGHDVKPGFDYGVARWDLKAALRTALDAARDTRTESGEASG